MAEFKHKHVCHMTKFKVIYMFILQITSSRTTLTTLSSFGIISHIWMVPTGKPAVRADIHVLKKIK